MGWRSYGKAALLSLRPGALSFVVCLLATAMPWALGAFVVITAGMLLVLWTCRPIGAVRNRLHVSTAEAAAAMAVLCLIAMSTLGGALGGVMLGTGREWLGGTLVLMVGPALGATVLLSVAMGLRRAGAASASVRA